MATQKQEGLTPRTLPPVGAAEYIGVHVCTLHRWIARGLFPKATIRVGRTVRWSTQALDKFIAEGVQA